MPPNPPSNSRLPLLAVWSGYGTAMHLELKQPICSYIWVVSLKTMHISSRLKWAKSIPVIGLNCCYNHTLWGGTYLFSLYKGVPSCSMPGTPLAFLNFTAWPVPYTCWAQPYYPGSGSHGQLLCLHWGSPAWQKRSDLVFLFY